ncbi:MAG: class I SAM-dependent methyltransferase [Deltaproteobacteria bacterium]|nr:class I SAM-dependent methyltransferase [Deltaproteobacteria bacterium]
MEEKYQLLKNHLYNYLLRKRAIGKILKREKPGLILEVGSGISPVTTPGDHIIYSDASFLAMRSLKNDLGRGSFVVADVMRLPFKHGAFSHAVCSEVLEHVEDDRMALKELSRVLRPSGRLILTFPHRKFYFANDDRFVGHLRRYESIEMEDRLEEADLMPLSTEKILGPLEKATMMAVVYGIEKAQRCRAGRVSEGRSRAITRPLISLYKWVNRVYAAAAWADAKLMPRSLSSVLLIRAEKTDSGSSEK